MKINKTPEFYMMFATKIFFRFFFLGGGQDCCPCPPSPTPMDVVTVVNMKYNANVNGRGRNVQWSAINASLKLQCTYSTALRISTRVVYVRCVSSIFDEPKTAEFVFRFNMLRCFE